jgi:peroxiredoxin
MVQLGTPAPDFALPAVAGGTLSLDEAASGASALLVAFLCSHCPYVRRIEESFGRVTADYARRGVAAVGICSNDAEKYPDDGPAGLAEQAERAGFTFPYLIDESQEVAKAFGAVCTPDLFLYDGAHRLVYRGQFDDARPRNDTPSDGASLRAAMDAVLAGETPSDDQVPSLGCGIKWRPGNEPG